jgi:hypothetical protein
MSAGCYMAVILMVMMLLMQLLAMVVRTSMAGG